MDVVGFVVAYLAIGFVLSRFIFPMIIVYYLHRHSRKQNISKEIYNQYSEDFHEDLQVKEKLIDPAVKITNALRLYLLWPYELPRRAVQTLNHELGMLSTYKEDEE